MLHFGETDSAISRLGSYLRKLSFVNIATSVEKEFAVHVRTMRSDVPFVGVLRVHHTRSIGHFRLGAVLRRRSTNLDLGPLRRSASTIFGRWDCRRSEGPESARCTECSTASNQFLDAQFYSRLPINARLGYLPPETPFPAPATQGETVQARLRE